MGQGHFSSSSSARRGPRNKLDGWVGDDTFVLVYSERSFRAIEDDEHIVPGVGYDRAETYLDLERTLEELAAGGSESRQGIRNRVHNKIRFHRPIGVVEHEFCV